MSKSAYGSVKSPLLPVPPPNNRLHADAAGPACDLGATLNVTSARHSSRSTTSPAAQVKRNVSRGEAIFVLVLPVFWAKRAGRALASSAKSGVLTGPPRNGGAGRRRLSRLRGGGLPLPRHACPANRPSLVEGAFSARPVGGGAPACRGGGVLPAAVAAAAPRHTARYIKVGASTRRRPSARCEGRV